MNSQTPKGGGYPNRKCVVTYKLHYPCFVVAFGVGVHRTRFKSCSFHPAALSMASALRAAAVPIAVRLSKRRAAGVKFPAASEGRGVQLGGPIAPFFAVLPLKGVRDTLGVRPPRPKSPALTRRLFDALLDSLWEMASRDVGAAMWNGVLGGGRSSDCDIMRGVALSVPQVINCFTAAGPSSSGVGDGKFGTNEKLFIVGDFGR